MSRTVHNPKSFSIVEDKEYYRKCRKIRSKPIARNILPMKYFIFKRIYKDDKVTERWWLFLQMGMENIKTSFERNQLKIYVLSSSKFNSSTLRKAYLEYNSIKIFRILINE